MRRLYHERLEKKAFKMSIVLMLRDLEPQERSRMIDELTERTFKIPFSDKQTLSRSVIYQWLREYSQATDRANVLLPKERTDRDKFRCLSTAQKNALLSWRSANPYRTAAQLREELMAHAATNSTPIPSESTIARFLRSVHLDRKTLLQKGTPQAKTRLAYESPYPQWLWLADTKGPNLQVRDPANPDQTRLAKPILFIDANSRFFVAACYVFEENEQAVLLLFRQAIALYGIPNSLYVDRGSPYMGQSLNRAATLLGCRIIHTKPGDAAAKGRVERPMRFFYERLETELALRSTPPTMAEANEYLAALVGQDYHRTVHSSTGQTPEERFFQFPAQYRRFVSKDTLALVMLPCTRSKVSKTGLIHLHNRQYLVPDAGLYGKWVEVRYDPTDYAKVYVWFSDRYYGEAAVYVAQTDYLKRQEQLAKLRQLSQQAEPAPPDNVQVPPYGYLERKLAAHRQELAELELNEVLSQVRAKKDQIKAELVQTTASSGSQPAGTGEMGREFGLDSFAHLLTVLFKRTLDAHERLALATVWRNYGPFSEALVRKTVGRLLGEGHPVSDLMGYLEALRLAVK